VQRGRAAGPLDDDQCRRGQPAVLDQPGQNCAHRTAGQLVRGIGEDDVVRPDGWPARQSLHRCNLDLGLEAEVGSLTPGKRADLTVLSLAGSPYDPVEDPAVGVVFGGSPSGVLETIVDGTTRYRQGESAWQEVRSTASAARRRMLA